MKHSMIAWIAALALLTAGLALAPASVANENHTADDRSAHKAERGAARDAYKEGKADERQRYTDAMRDAAMGHRACARDGGDNNTTADTNGTDKAACHKAAAIAGKELREAARDHYRIAKDRLHDLYKDRLAAARDAYLHDQVNERRCAESVRCVEKQIAVLEAKQARAQTVQGFLENKLERLEAQLANATGDNNTTSNEAYRIQDAIYGVQIKLLKIERLLFRIEVQLEHWYGVLEDLQDDDAPSTTPPVYDNSTADAPGNTTA